MLLSLIKKRKKERKTNNKKGKEKNKTTTIQTKAVTTYNSPGLHYRWRCYQEIALNGQHVGPTSFAPLPLSNANSASTPRRWSLD